MENIIRDRSFDEERALSAARAVDPKRLQPEAPIFKSVGTSFRATRVSDVQGGDKAGENVERQDRRGPATEIHRINEKMPV